MNIQDFFSLNRFFFAWFIAYIVGALVGIWFAMPGHFNPQIYAGKGPTTATEWLCPTFQGGRLCSSKEFWRMLVTSAPALIFIALWFTPVPFYFVVAYVLLTVADYILNATRHSQ